MGAESTSPATRSSRRRARDRRPSRPRNPRTCPARASRCRPDRARRHSPRRRARGVADGHRLRPAAAAGDEERLLDLEEEVARSFEAEPSTPSPTRTFASRRSRTGRPRHRGAGWTSGSARRRCRSRRRVDVVRAGARSARTTRRRRASRAVRGTRPACSRRARGSTPPHRHIGACSGRPRRRASAADSSISFPSPKTVSRERPRAARGRRVPARGARPRAARCLRARVEVLDELVGRKAAVRLAEIHRATRRDDADPELARRLHLRLDEPGTPTREDVVVVEHRRATESASSASPVRAAAYSASASTRAQTG